MLSDWLVVYPRLYTGVWPKIGKGEKANATAAYAIAKVKDQDDNPSKLAASAAEYMLAMQKRSSGLSQALYEGCGLRPEK
ncbi:hypothetical protein SARC_16890, partial [Sphaeroforma arctica JP610]